MKPNLTLKHLADLGAEAALEVQEDRLGASMLNLSPVGPQAIYYEQDRPAREAFVKAVLDAIGYQFPVDPEREAYDKWFSSHPSPEPFDAWKAGREELRKQSGPANGSDTPETFEAHGHIWFKHKPGDPAPVEGHVKVRILLRGGEYTPKGVSLTAGTLDWGVEEDPSADTIGWRYAE